jgi:hypothetical protein
MKLWAAVASIVFGGIVTAKVAWGVGETPTDWIGAWELTETVNYSSCDDIDMGDVRVSQLTVSTSKGQVVGTQMVGTTAVSFAGTFRGSTLLLNTPARKLDHAALELALDGSGRRIVSRIGTFKGPAFLASPTAVSCALVYDVRAIRK